MRHVKRILLLFITVVSTFPRGGRAGPAAGPPDFLTGAIVPLVTPYTGTSAAKVDLPALDRLVDYLCSSRATALFAVSGTGQWDRLSMTEKRDVISACVRAAQGRKPILAGVGSMNNMEETLETARFAERAGAAAVVAVTPDFIRRSQPLEKGLRRIRNQDLLFAYYQTIAGAVHCPVVVYDPESEVDPGTVKRLVLACPNIKALKVRERKDMGKFRRLTDAAGGRAAVLSGSELTALAAMQHGADGMIGNGLNVYPDLAQDLIDACRRRDWALARRLQARISEANGRLERLGGGAQGIKKILNDVAGVRMETANRGDTFRAESVPGEYKGIEDYFRAFPVRTYRPSLR